MAGYLLDTNILIAWFGQLPGHQHLEALLGQRDTELYTSVVCVAEFLAGCDDEDASVLQAIVQAGEIKVVPFASLEEARVAAEYRKTLGLKMPDAIVASAAGVRHLGLVTLDTRLAKTVAGVVRVL